MGHVARLQINITQTACATWTTTINAIKCLAHDMYHRHLSLQQRVQFVHEYLLSKLWYIAQFVPVLSNSEWQYHGLMIPVARRDFSSAIVHIAASTNTGQIRINWCQNDMYSTIHMACYSTNKMSDHPNSGTVHSTGRETATRESTWFMKCPKICRVSLDLLPGKMLHAEHNTTGDGGQTSHHIV